MATGLGAIYDQGAMKYSLGFVTTNLPATPTTVAISLHSSVIGTAKVLTGEFTQTSTGYVRIKAGTSSNGQDSANWTVAAFVAGTGVVATNATQVSFAAAAGAGWPINLLAVGFFDTTTYNTGNLLWFADVTSQAIAVGIIVAFFIGDVSLTLL